MLRLPQIDVPRAEPTLEKPGTNVGSHGGHPSGTTNILHSTALAIRIDRPEIEARSNPVRRYLSSCRDNCPDGDISECWLMEVYLRFRNLLRAGLEGVGQR